MRKAPFDPSPPAAIAVALMILVSFVYWQTGEFSFTNLDDDPYITSNPHVLRGLTREGVSWAFTTVHVANWHPLTWLSHMADVEIFGPDPGWHHRVNALFHLVNTELLFLVLWRTTGALWRGALVAALFGVHPLHVESVAWVAERKDLLSTLFWILTMWAYLRYVRRPGPGRYGLVAASLAMGLMCKPMLVTLPFVLLLLDVWPLGRIPAGRPPGRERLRALSRLACEKIPLLALSAASCAATYLAQVRGEAVRPLEFVPLAARVSNAVASYAAYLSGTVWPAKLAVFYPHPASIGETVPGWRVAGSVLLLCALSLVAFRAFRRRPWIAVGWLWFLGTLVPVIGLVQVGGQAMADRYTYVPLIGIFVALSWSLPAPVPGGKPLRRLAPAAGAAAAVIALAVAAFLQAGYWRDSATLLSRAIAVTDRNWLAWNNLGLDHYRQGRTREAIACFREALRIAPACPEPYYNLGLAYDSLEMGREALLNYREAVRYRPDSPSAWNNLGVSLARTGRTEEAAACFREAVRLRPGYGKAWRNLGKALEQLGRTGEALECLANAERLGTE